MTNNREHPERPILGVGAVIIREDRVVLIKRGQQPKEGEWSLPGGGVKIGETTREAILREIHEETGLEVTLKELIDVIDYIEPSSQDGTNGIKFHYALVDYLAYYKSGELKAASDAADARYFSFADIEKMPLWSETKRVIEAARHIAKTHTEI
jgi:ADP-ribose pyrophosphatase YjhB (NUDIX family)